MPDKPEDLIEQYALPDSSFSAELDLDPSELSPPKPAGKPPPSPATTAIPNPQQIPASFHVDAAQAEAVHLGGKPAERERGPDGRFIRQPAHPQHLVHMARNLGIAEADLAEMDTQELRELVRDQTFYLAAMNRQRPLEVSTSSPPVQAQAASASGPVVGTGEGDVDIDWGSEDGKKLTDSDFAQPIVKIVKQFTRQIQQLEARLAEVSQYQQLQQRQEAVSRVDRIFQKHKSVLGEGAEADIKPASPEYARRQAVVGLVNQMKDGTLEERVDRAMALLFGAAGTPAPAPSHAAPTAREEEWRNGGLLKPTGRVNTSEPKGQQRAQRAIAQKMREAGVTDESFDGIEEQGLPG